MSGPDGVGPPQIPPGLLNNLPNDRGGPHRVDSPNPNSPNSPNSPYDVDDGLVQTPRNGDPDFNPSNPDTSRGNHLSDAGRNSFESQAQNLYAAFSRESQTSAPLGTTDARLLAPSQSGQVTTANTPSLSTPANAPTTPTAPGATTATASTVATVTSQPVQGPATPMLVQTATSAHLIAPGTAAGVEQLAASLRPDALPTNPAANLPPTLALPGVAAGATMAVSPAVDPRGVTLPANDRVPGVRGELQAQGNTIVTAWRRRARNKSGPFSEHSHARSLFNRDSDADNGTQAWQWLFWILGIVAYASIALAIVVLMPGGGGIFSDSSSRGTSGGLIALGCVCFAVAWWVARRMRRR